MKKLFKRFVSNYLNSKVILLVDMLTAFSASVIVLLFLKFFLNADFYSDGFVLSWLAGSFVFAVLSMFVFRTFNVVLRHTTIKDFKRYVLAILCAHLLLDAFLTFSYGNSRTLHLAVLSCFLLTVVLVSGVRFFAITFFSYLRHQEDDSDSKQCILIYGTSESSVAAIFRFSDSKRYSISGFISRGAKDRNLRLAGYPVINFETEDDFMSIVKCRRVCAVLFTSKSDVKEEEDGIIKYCSGRNIQTLITSFVDETFDGNTSVEGVRKIRIEDLLGRPEIKISLNSITDSFKGKRVLVTGAAGSIGSELCRKLAVLGVKRLVLLDNAESPLHYLRLELESRFPETEISPIIGSVCHERELDYVFRTYSPQIVFHAAAYKHVPLMEENPCEAIFTNVLGSRLIADKCVEYNVEKMLMISTDKAVNPTNIMGCSKRLAEIYVQSLALALEKGEVKGNTQFVTTRFGNVLGSNGSVIPRFREQIENGGPVTVTHPDIVRYFMTIPEACSLVMEAATLCSGNRIFVFDMGEPVRIADLAVRMIELAGLKPGKDIRIEYTGLRPGEKLYEEVLSDAENTEPTSHDMIRVAKVREYDYSEVCRKVDELTELSKVVNVPDMVRLMKRMVPEYKSRNSVFEKYD